VCVCVCVCVCPVTQADTSAGPPVRRGRLQERHSPQFPRV
jgi:hypothetical protein